MRVELRAVLERRFRTTEWLGRSLLDENLFAINHQLGGRELPGWSLRSGRRVSVPSPQRSTRFANVVPNAPVSQFSTVWLPDHGDPNTVVLTDVFSYESLSAAHESVLMLMSRFESPFVQWCPDPEFGDAVFRVPDQATSIVFVRANVVYVISNAGPTVVNVEPMARALDSNLISRPRVPGRRTRATINQSIPSRALQMADDGRWAIDSNAVVELANDEDTQRWYKIFSGSVEVTEYVGQSVDQSLSRPSDPTIYAVDRSGTHTEISLSDLADSKLGHRLGS